MRVLLVHSGNGVAGLSSTYTFVHEQGEALRARGVEVEYYAVVGKGVWGYLRNVRPLRQKIADFQPDIVHAHYGLSGMLAVLSAHRIPVVITCHNGETLTPRGNFFSSIALRYARHTIFVAQHIYNKLYFHPKNYTILPCGIDLENLPIVPKAKAQEEMGLPKDKINILFGGAFANERKNEPLARKAIGLLKIADFRLQNGKEINLIEMKGYNRHEVAMMLCGCDMMLLPTKSEGSPQVVKEAMACNCPVVATDVADIAHLLHGVKNSYVTSFDPADIAEKIRRVIDSGERSDGIYRIQALKLSNPEVAEAIHNLYCSILGVELTATTTPTATEDAIQVLAFYLPQYHPIPENNEWFGEGFTEWTNVGKAKPLFRNHYQPLVPADLGYYDLRLPQVRARQAELAREAGVSAFCYYHYWFGNGKQLLEMPLQEVTRLGEPDFPFCICWANHTWYNKMWNAERSVLDMVPLMEQKYPGPQDWDAHFYALIDTFRDKRYYRINGRLVWVFYHVADIPDAEQMMARWNELAEKEGLGGFYYMSYVDDVKDINNPAHQLCKDIILSCKENITSVGHTTGMRKLARFSRIFFSQLLHIPFGIYRYSRVRHKLLDPRFAEEDIVPVIYPNWDNTARRKMGATVLHEATPEQFYKHCKEVFALMRGKKNRVVFLKSWNEWGEGNYMEPCLRYGHGYIRALRKALDECNPKD